MDNAQNYILIQLEYETYVPTTFVQSGCTIFFRFNFVDFLLIDPGYLIHADRILVKKRMIQKNISIRVERVNPVNNPIIPPK